jgi:hypothetical protein
LLICARYSNDQIALPHFSPTLADQRRQIGFYKRLYQLIAALE